MTDAETGQVLRSAAEIYEEFFVPALFAGWARPVCDAAEIGPGDAVLDVACGTGVLAREAAGRAGLSAVVVGLDRNDGMLAVARRAAPLIDWREGRAEAMPYADAAFDAVVSQFGLMFFDDRLKALAEMWRVLKPGGRLAVAVWDGLDRTPGYAAMTALLLRLFGENAANALRMPYVLGDTAAVARLIADAGIAGATVAAMPGTVRFPSIRQWVHTDVKGWTLADMIDEVQYEALQREAERELDRFVQPDGSVAFASPAIVATARKV